MIGIPSHNELQVGDTLSDISFNYKTRLWLSELVQDRADFLRLEMSELERDGFDTYVDKLLGDLYTASPIVGDDLIGVKASRDTNLALGVGFTVIPLESADYDTDSFWTIAQDTRLTIPVGRAGYYQATAGGTCLGNAGTNALRILLNGVDILGMSQSLFNTSKVFSVSADVYLNEGDYIEMEWYATVGTTLFSANKTNKLSLVWLGE